VKGRARQITTHARKKDRRRIKDYFDWRGYVSQLDEATT
jgi:hypothetical protein